MRAQASARFPGRVAKRWNGLREQTGRLLQLFAPCPSQITRRLVGRPAIDPGRLCSAMSDGRGAAGAGLPPIPLSRKCWVLSLARSSAHVRRYRPVGRALGGRAIPSWGLPPCSRVWMESGKRNGDVGGYGRADKTSITATAKYASPANAHFPSIPVPFRSPPEKDREYRPKHRMDERPADAVFLRFVTPYRCGGSLRGLLMRQRAKPRRPARNRRRWTGSLPRYCLG
jgi:hypothetical protein